MLNDSQQRIIQSAASELPTQEQRQLFVQLVQRQVAVRTVDVVDAISSRAQHYITAESEQK